MKRTTVYLPDTLKQRVERTARERNVSEAEVIRAAIDEFTRGEARPAPTLPLFPSLGVANISERVDELLADGFGGD